MSQCQQTVHHATLQHVVETRYAGEYSQPSASSFKSLPSVGHHRLPQQPTVSHPHQSHQAATHPHQQPQQNHHQPPSLGTSGSPRRLPQLQPKIRRQGSDENSDPLSYNSRPRQTRRQQPALPRKRSLERQSGFDNHDRHPTHVLPQLPITIHSYDDLSIGPHSEKQRVIERQRELPQMPCDTSRLHEKYYKTQKKEEVNRQDSYESCATSLGTEPEVYEDCYTDIADLQERGDYGDFYPEDETKELLAESKWIFDNEQGWVPNPASSSPTPAGHVKISTLSSHDKSNSQHFTGGYYHPAKGLGAKISAVLGGDVVTVVGSQTGHEPLDNSTAPPPPAPDFPGTKPPSRPNSGSGIRRSSPVSPSMHPMNRQTSKTGSKVHPAPSRHGGPDSPSSRQLPNASLRKKESWKKDSAIWKTVVDEDGNEQRAFGDEDSPSFHANQKEMQPSSKSFSSPPTVRSLPQIPPGLSNQHSHNLNHNQQPLSHPPTSQAQQSHMQPPSQQKPIQPPPTSHQQPPQQQQLHQQPQQQQQQLKRDQPPSSISQQQVLNQQLANQRDSITSLHNQQPQSALRSDARPSEPKSVTFSDQLRQEHSLSGSTSTVNGNDMGFQQTTNGTATSQANRIMPAASTAQVITSAADSVMSMQGGMGGGQLFNKDPALPDSLVTSAEAMGARATDPYTSTAPSMEAQRQQEMQAHQQADIQRDLQRRNSQMYEEEEFFDDQDPSLMMDEVPPKAHLENGHEPQLPGSAVPAASHARETVSDALTEFAPPDCADMSTARVRWISAFNKIIAQWTEVSWQQVIICARYSIASQRPRAHERVLSRLRLRFPSLNAGIIFAICGNSQRIVFHRIAQH